MALARRDTGIHTHGLVEIGIGGTFTDILCRWPDGPSGDVATRPDIKS